VPFALVGDQVRSVHPGKPDGLGWQSELYSFPAPKIICLANGRRTHGGHLLHSSLFGQNPKKVLTILGGSALAMVPMDHTTPPKEDKVNTS
jgi:hypothetical protein